MSKPGHILGDLRRSDDNKNDVGVDSPKGERLLDASSCAVLRFLTHLAMLVASLLHPQQVRNHSQVPPCMHLVHC